MVGPWANVPSALLFCNKYDCGNLSEPSPTQILGQSSNTQAIHAHFCPSLHPIYQSYPFYIYFKIMAFLRDLSYNRRRCLCIIRNMVILNIVVERTSAPWRKVIVSMKRVFLRALAVSLLLMSFSFVFVANPMTTPKAFASGSTSASASVPLESSVGLTSEIKIRSCYNYYTRKWHPCHK